MSEEKQTPYRVLARKYRPQNFDDLYGQDALVRTLKNAIESGRIAQAYMLTGIRGTGKTTTARIIAKALNYKGADGNAGPTTGPTDDCDLCKAIAEDRHPDVMEMDAASRTGVDDIREILDGVRYAPTSARYKVYIIDEVHMLSKAAFNALLKTLEEPPEHVIFIFATTEIRKVPVTVLSRCQRFDLRRIDAQTLARLYKDVAAKENVQVEDEALALIARAADGSARDGMSLLDQAIALGGETITAAQVQDMLGLADRMLVLDILEAALKGDCPKALDLAADLYKKGADPSVLINDMLDFTHLLTRTRAVPQMKDGQGAVAQETLDRLADLSGKLSMPTLGRAWQILLKGLGEVNHAPNPQAAAEMVIIRLAYAADLPDPGELLKKLKDQPAGSAAAAPAAAASPAAAERAPEPVAMAAAGGGGVQAVAAAPQIAAQAVSAHELCSIADIENVLSASGNMVLASEVYQYVHLVKLQPGKLEIRPEEQARPELASELRRVLSEITDTRWMVSVSGLPGAPTLAEQQEQLEATRIAAAKQNPVVCQVLEIFPDAAVKVRTNS
ncbi:MAG: DNA polymerase III subunit gamma/tau [Rhodospirillales bacterium]|nr:DNA polymerase III subunit gamma/tau [Rhodospirillales bacterium]MCB9996258.1 DNA polymerase III subunit gamma/tau [Rhodospirillales bacterium]